MKTKLRVLKTWQANDATLEENLLRWLNGEPLENGGTPRKESRERIFGFVESLQSLESHLAVAAKTRRSELVLDATLRELTYSINRQLAEYPTVPFVGVNFERAELVTGNGIVGNLRPVEESIAVRSIIE